MNAAHDIKILEYWICIYSLVEGVFKKCFLESKILPSINRYPIYKEKTFWKKMKKMKGFALVGSGFIIEANDDLSK